jgi:hypothetical protein
MKAQQVENLSEHARTKVQATREFLQKGSIV